MIWNMGLGVVLILSRDCWHIWIGELSQNQEHRGACPICRPADDGNIPDCFDLLDPVLWCSL